MSLPTGYLWGSYTFTGKGAAVDHIYQPAIVQNPTFNDGDSDGPFIAFFYGETTGTFNANGVNTVTNNVFALDPFLTRTQAAHLRTRPWARPTIRVMRRAASASRTESGTSTRTSACRPPSTRSRPILPIMAGARTPRQFI